MRESFARMGISDDFRDLPRELHIVAADIETDKRVSFSKFSHADVPVSRAVAASTCIPILFRPTDIEGRHYVDGGIKGHAAIDLAIQRGAKLIIVINGLVPLDTAGIRERTTYAGVRRSIYELGVRAIYNQVVRGMLHDTLTEHSNAVRERNPDVDIILIEPRPDDAKMFFHEVMSFSAQLIVLQHGYESVINGLYRSWSLLAKIFPEHGIEITRQVVERKPLQVPVEEASSKALLSRLRQTVLDQRTPTSLPPKRAAAAARRRKRAPAPGRTQTRRSGDRANFKPRVISGGAKS